MLRFLRSLHLNIQELLACIQGTPVPLTSVEAEPPLPSIQPAQPASSSAQEHPSADVLIELKNVYKSFGSKAILRGANITIRRGEAVGIIGGSGTGKSTTLRIMAGLLMPDAVWLCHQMSVGEMYTYCSAEQHAPGGGQHRNHVYMLSIINAQIQL